MSNRLSIEFTMVQPLRHIPPIDCEIAERQQYGLQPSSQHRRHDLKMVRRQNRCLREGIDVQAVIGLNTARGKTGIADLVLTQLRGELPDHVTIVEPGEATVSLIDTLLSHDSVVIVGEVRGGAPAGTIYRLTPEQYSSLVPTARLARELSLANTLDLALSIGSAAHVIVFGVEPQNAWEPETEWDPSVVRSAAAVVRCEIETRHTHSAAAVA
jgi:hydrogenase maturation protease